MGEKNLTAQQVLNTVELWILNDGTHARKNKMENTIYMEIGEDLSTVAKPALFCGEARCWG